MHTLTKRASLAALLATAIFSASAFASPLTQPSDSELVLTGEPVVGSPLLTRPPEPASITIREMSDVKFFVGPDGNMTFGDGATIDFADTKPYAGNPGPWVVIKVQGKKYVVQAFEYIE